MRQAACIKLRPEFLATHPSTNQTDRIFANQQHASTFYLPHTPDRKNSNEDRTGDDWFSTDKRQQPINRRRQQLKE
jgi:hypothetical protein